MGYEYLRNMMLRSLTEASDEDEQKKQKEQEEKEKQKQKEEEAKEKEKEQEKEQKENNDSEDDKETEPQEEDQEDVSEDPAGDEEEPAADEGDTGDDTDAGGDEGAGDDMGDGGEDPLTDGSEDVTDIDGGAEDGEFDMGAGDGENPDGLPSADDDGSSTSDDEDAETNLQVNIMKLSKLDRALAKKTCFEYFASLRSTIEANLNTIDRNEAVIDADVREAAVADLTELGEKVKAYLRYKFPIVNYEEGLLAYFEFVREVNRVIEHIRQDGITQNGRKPKDPDKHKNKGNR